MWPRLLTVMHDGLLGPARPGGEPMVDASGPAPGPDAVPVGDQPAWLASPEIVVPEDTAAAVAGLETMVAAAQFGAGNLAVFARWTGDPGRSPLAALAVTPEAGPDDTYPVLYLAGPGTLDDPKVTAALADVVGPGGVGVVGHDVKELMRSLLPMGVDITGLVMDTAVAAYLLDSSIDRYHLVDLARQQLGVVVDDPTVGQGSFALADADADTGAGDVGIDADVLQSARLVSVVARLRDPLDEALADTGATALLA